MNIFFLGSVMSTFFINIDMTVSIDYTKNPQMSKHFSKLVQGNGTPPLSSFLHL